ncbi:MAG: glycosyltransferase family 4 protein [archaeon]|nr:glycosyltransferase family 4 protein [archaeon]
MNILIVTPVFPPNIGGIEQHTLNLAKELKNSGNNVVVLTTKIGLKNNPNEQFDFPVCRVNARLSSNKDLAVNGRRMIPQLAIKCLELCRKHKIELIHAHCPFSMLSSIPSKILLGKRIVLTVHGNWINCVKGSRYYNNQICTTYEAQKCSKCMKQSVPEILLKQKVLANSAGFADQIIAVSNDVKNSIKLKKQKQIHIIPNISSNFAVQQIIPEKDVLFIGSLHKEKGAVTMIKSIALLKQKFPKISAGIAFAHKDEAYFDEIKKEISQNGLQNNMKFYENIPNNELRQQIIPLHELVVLPSLWPEPCSTVITETMNAGRTIIASNVGGNTDLIKEKVNGLLFDAGDEKILAEKIELGLTNVPLNKLIHKNSVQLIEKKLNWEKIARKTMNVYRSAMM